MSENAKKGAFKNSAYGIIKAAELDYYNKKTEEKPIEIIYTYTDGVETSNPSGNNLEFNGNKPQNGTVIVNIDGEIAIAIHDGKYCATKNYNDTEITISERIISDCVIPYSDIILNGADPEINEGMIPIRWDGTKWIKANIGQEWYNYAKKEWANVALVTETTRNTYINATPGTEIKEVDILAYLVWAPRYKYKLFNVESAITSPKEIEIIFQNKNNLKSNGNTNGSWLTHPAFTFSSNELNGFWVGKFETTGNATTPTVKPKVASLRSQNISTQFVTSQKFNDLTTYGITSNNDAHMMKNMEWGAVAYLSHSKYGKDAEIWINPSSDYITGCAGTSVNAGLSSGCSYHYTTSNGQQVSTTGNIYGIYDMSGGTSEYVMGGMYNSDNTTIMVKNSGFAQAIIDETGMEKYIDKYTYGTTYNDQTAFNRRKLGDATGETRGWYNDDITFIHSTWPWFVRGGYHDDGDNAGAFGFVTNEGYSYSNCGFRLTISTTTN